MIIPFLLSASRVVFSARLCFQGDFVKTSPLVSLFTKRRQSSATLRCHYSLPTKRPTVVGRWFYVLVGFYGVGFLPPSLREVASPWRSRREYADEAGGFGYSLSHFVTAPSEREPS